MSKFDVTRELERLLEVIRPRAGSLAITVFGDCIAPQGGTVWLGSLVELMTQFGLNPRQVRTALFRLARDGWLESQQAGRRSYYSLSPTGQRQFERAARRIYATEPASWNGEWTLLMPGETTPLERDELRRRCTWLGFGLLANQVLAHPRASREAVDEVLAELGLQQRVIVWRARPADDRTLLGLVNDAWLLEQLEEQLRAFIELFAPFLDWLKAHAMPLPCEAFVLRSLLVHEYRRILLRTIDLPEALWPQPWSGQVAMRLASNLYRLVHAPASRHASVCLSNAEGPLPAPRPDFYQRFGGLRRTPVTAAA